MHVLLNLDVTDTLDTNEIAIDFFAAFNTAGSILDPFSA